MLKKKNHTPLALRIIPNVFPWLEKLSPELALRFFVYIFTTPFRYKAPAKEIAVTKRAEKFTVNLDGKKIQCYSWGSGPAVLLIHGWAGRGAQLRKFIGPLNKSGYRAIAVDGPAHGASEGKSTHPEEFARTIFLVSEKAGGLKAIVAHSFGGIGSLYAITLGLPTRTLINIASPAIGDEIIKTYLKAINGSEKTGEAFKKRVLEKTGKPFNALTSIELIKNAPSDLRLLLVHDEQDRDVSLQHPLAVAKQFPSAQLLQTTGLGHNRILKDEGVINNVVTFIEKHSSGS